jgi:hypothetical protein
MMPLFSPAINKMTFAKPKIRLRMRRRRQKSHTKDFTRTMWHREKRRR